MKYLLDTHSLIWFIEGNLQLSVHARQVIDNEGNELFISIASLWEMAIKFSISKLDLGQPFESLFPAQLEHNSIEILGITVEHLKAVCNLPFYHRDPFDRLIIAQAQVEQLPIISLDKIFDSYGVKREW
ncbi:MAG: type II toxin-antitoxin system VapC family toxin [Abitibacteriaceae bacterium]|nr:type II toxin-antitoxin system VapC family toxin [Abditibacteriaceae bacterium]MBV9864289.1 type II toxin-antitoxin system VapC family toxin [Abditibacteriaceae bacterium]